MSPRCKFCGETDINKLKKNKSMQSGVQNLCNKCCYTHYTKPYRKKHGNPKPNLKTKEQKAEYNKKYRRDNAEYFKNYKAERKELFKEKYKKIKLEWYAFFKECGITKCSSCGYNRSFEALDFHHRDPEKKEFNISRFMTRKFSDKNKEIMLKELNKCDILCSNCHRELHSNGGTMVDNNKLGKIVDDGKAVFECICCGYKYVADLKAGVKSCPRCSRGPEHIVIRGDLMVIK